MSKKPYRMTKLELADTFVPIFCVCWVLVFAYIALFLGSNVMALITIMPVFFLYALYLVGSAVYDYKEEEILETLGRDTYEVQKRNRKKKKKLSTQKLVFAGIFFVCGVLLCIFL